MVWALHAVLLGAATYCDRIFAVAMIVAWRIISATTGAIRIIGMEFACVDNNFEPLVGIPLEQIVHGLILPDIVVMFEIQMNSNPCWATTLRPPRIEQWHV